MLETQLCCLVLLAASFGVSSSGTGIIKKYGCRQHSVKLFQNITFPNNNTVVSLFKNGDINVMIAEWQNNVMNTMNGYSGKLHLDKYGNMWLLNLRESDDATYKVKMSLEKNAAINEVELVVMVAPSKKCKPEIVRAGNSLFASVDQTECGKPAASVHWMEHSTFLVSPQVLTLQNEQFNCTYHACIKSDALRCVDVFNVADYCTVFKCNTTTSGSDTTSNTSENVPSTCSESDMHFSIFTTILSVIILIILIILGLFILFKWKSNCPFRRNRTTRDGIDPSMTPLTGTSNQALSLLEKDQEETVHKGTETNPSENRVHSSSEAANDSNTEENEQN